VVNWESFYSSFREPDFIPGYEIQHRLGGGAFGEVYKAKKTSIGKPYAIKFLKLDDQADRDVIQRELEQVRLFASIDHPNLVTIEDMGLAMDVPYLILGYAGEETLARRLKGGPMERDPALRTFVQVCRGVLALHDRRLAHFDVKPGNVFLKGDVARVGDYGLSKLLVEGRSSLSFGRGTPHYMAPEMLKNRADQRADVYSLGVVLYECLTGRVPYGAELGGVVLREHDEPPPFPPAFPAPLRATVETCLRLSPEDRFESVHELLEDLGQTARQGDSVRLPWSGPGGRAFGAYRTPPEPAPPAQDAGAGERSAFRRDDLRQAAGELARGAVGVARGVWDGVRGRGEVLRPGSPAQTPEPGEAVESGAGEPGDDAAGTPGFGAGDDVVSVRTLADSDDAPRTALAVRPATGAFATEALSIPVPPRESGGAVGAIAATAVLGAEILATLITGPVLALLRGTRGVLDRTLQGLPVALGAAARLCLFVAVCFGLGAATALVILGALMGDKLYIP
jgi:hypothetical protein